MKLITKERLKRLFYILSPIKCIQFESCPDFSDNTKAVFDELLRRGYNRKYKLVWVLFDEGERDYPKIKNVVYMRQNDRRYIWVQRTTKCYIECNHFLVKYSGFTKVMDLTHASDIKSCAKHYQHPPFCNYIFASSEWNKLIFARENHFPIEKITALGFPRNDSFAKEKINLADFFGNYKKYIIWYPTFRQHRYGGDICACTTSLPIIHDEKNAILLNNKLKENNCLIVLKPHFAQDLSYIHDPHLSNIVIINDDFFVKNGISSYQFVASHDALLSDYSSIYCDYTLCDKPIGLIWEDIEQYKNNPGLVDEYETICKGGVKIYNINDLCSFIKDVADNVDELQQERNEICDVLNYSRDGYNSVRVVDFIVENSKL